MNLDCIGKIVELNNYKNTDGSLTDIKFYINEFRYEDGDLQGYEFYDYSTKTVTDSEIIMSESVEHETLLKLKEIALGEIMATDEQYIELDLGGSFE